MTALRNACPLAYGLTRISPSDRVADADGAPRRHAERQALCRVRGYTIRQPVRVVRHELEKRRVQALPRDGVERRDAVSAVVDALGDEVTALLEPGLEVSHQSVEHYDPPEYVRHSAPQRQGGHRVRGGSPGKDQAVRIRAD